MKNRILYRCLETNRYLMYHNSKQNGHQQAKSGVDRRKAQAFLDAQPFKAQQKIFYNIFKVEEGVMKVDIFKKQECTQNLEVLTQYL